MKVEPSSDTHARDRQPRPLSTHRFLILLVVWFAAAPWLLFPEQRPIFTAASLLLVLFIWSIIWRFHRPILGSLDGYIVVFLGLTALAFLVSPLPQTSLPKLLTILFGATGFYLVRAWLVEPSRLWSLILALALAGGIVAFLGLFTLEWPQRQVLDVQMFTDRLPHLSGAFSINFNEMAGTLLFLLPFAWAGVWAVPSEHQSRGWRFVLAACLLLMALVMLLTQSRGAFLGLLAAILAGFSWGRFPIRRLLLPLLIVISLLLLAAVLLSWDSADIFAWLDRVDAGSKSGAINTSSWLSRLEIWRNAVQLLWDYPVLGAGLYTFEPVSRANYVYELSPPMLNIAHAHNLFLQTGASLGWGGLILIVLFLSFVFRGLWSVAWRGDDRLARLAPIFGASLTGYVAFNMYDTITLGQKPGALVWLVLAGSAALIQGQTEEKASVRWPLWDWIGPLLPLILFLALALSPLITRNRANLALDQVRFGQGDPAGLQVEQFTGDARRQGLLSFLSDRLAEALAYWQNDPQAAAFLANQGQTAAEKERLAESLVWYELALAFDSDSSLVYYWQGEVYEAQGRVDQALDSYQKAVDYAPSDNINSDWEAHIYFSWGQLLAQQKQWAAAAEAYEQAIRLKSNMGYYFQALGDVLTRLGDEAGAAAAYTKAQAEN